MSAFGAVGDAFYAAAAMGWEIPEDQYPGQPARRDFIVLALRRCGVGAVEGSHPNH